MNPVETGKLIAKFRKEAGYTQASLASALNITDKAVSKWERGCSLPDASLLPKIAKLLDCDIEVLLSGLSEYKEHEWVGVLILESGETSASTVVYDKPLIFYLLSYFLLVGITEIDIQAKFDDAEYIKSLNLEQYGFNISFTPRTHSNAMIIYDKLFLFGVNLTRSFQNYMSMEANVVPITDGRELPIIFAHHYSDTEILKKISEKKKMGRGMLNFPMTTNDEVNEVAEFVKTYQKYHKLKIADLHEIAVKREMI